jgi:hypothetical protein
MLIATSIFKNRMDIVYGASAITTLGRTAGVSSTTAWQYGTSVLAIGVVSKEFGLSNTYSAILAFTVPGLLARAEGIIDLGYHKSYLAEYNRIKGEMENKMESGKPEKIMQSIELRLNSEEIESKKSFVMALAHAANQQKQSYNSQYNLC